MLHAERTYNEQAYQIFDHDDWRRLRNWRWVCSHIPTEERYNEEWVTYAHYREVVPLSKELRTYYLGRVVNEMLSARDLKNLIRKEAIDKIIDTLPQEEKNFWFAYAEKTDCTLDQFKAALANGRGWAEEQMNTENQPSFAEWYSRIENSPSFAKLDLKTQLAEAWFAAQEG
jgi:hypothetical protein